MLALFPTSELTFPFACDVLQGHSHLPQSLHRCLQARYISQVRILVIRCCHMLWLISAIYHPYLTHISPIYHPDDDPNSTWISAVKTKECSGRCSHPGRLLGQGPQGAPMAGNVLTYHEPILDKSDAFFGWNPHVWFLGFSSHARIFGNFGVGLNIHFTLDLSLWACGIRYVFKLAQEEAPPA